MPEIQRKRTKGGGGERAQIIAFRYMSAAEFRHYQTGATLHGRAQSGCFTDARGRLVVCFMPVIGDALGAARAAYEYLLGVVSNEMCAIFRISDPSYQEGSGRYADPYGAFLDTMWVREIYLDAYPRETAALIAHCRVPEDTDDAWEWTDEPSHANDTILRTVESTR